MISSTVARARAIGRPRGERLSRRASLLLLAGASAAGWAGIALLVGWLA